MYVCMKDSEKKKHAESDAESERLRVARLILTELRGAEEEGDLRGHGRARGPGQGVAARPKQRRGGGGCENM